MDKKGKFEKMAEMMKNCCKDEGELADCCPMMRKMMEQMKKGEKKKKRDRQKKNRDGVTSCLSGESPLLEIDRFSSIQSPGDITPIFF